MPNGGRNRTQRLGAGQHRMKLSWPPPGKINVKKKEKETKNNQLKVSSPMGAQNDLL